MAGGTSLYFSMAMARMDVNYILVTSLGAGEMRFVADLRAAGIEVKAYESARTVYFENIYSYNLNHRSQKVLQTADAFNEDQIKDIQASVFHLGPLLADDIPLELIRTLSRKGKISLDVQGYLRKVESQQVYTVDWKDKREALPYVHVLKANQAEMETLTGLKDIHEGAKILSDWGVKEVVITLGSEGSLIYADSVFYEIPAYAPNSETDTTGCGDTYMAGYLYQRLNAAPIKEAGKYGAALATLKIESPGPFKGSRTDVLDLLAKEKR
jgi:sugar/nucleoside kinase (ribokinase family)